MQNVLFLLYHHLSHDANAHLLPRLLEASALIGPHASRMLRVLSRQLFATHMYKTGKLIARGAYATVLLLLLFINSHIEIRCSCIWAWRSDLF
jgi:hypothetical protein